MPHSLFLDANVLFTAAHSPSGKAAFLFDVAAAPGAPWRLLSSAYAIEEARRNLAAKSTHGVAGFERICAVLSIVPQPLEGGPDLDLPSKDRPIWRAAFAGAATHLLTGDIKDFGAHMNRPVATGGVVIQTVGDCLASL